MPVCQVNRFIYDAQEFDFDHYDWAAIKIGKKSINPLYSPEVVQVLDEAGMQHCCIRIEWSFGDYEKEGHRLKLPSRIATNTLGEFLVVDKSDDTIKVFNRSGEFIYKINPQVDDTVTLGVATAVNNNTYILVWLSESGTHRCEVQVFTKTERRYKFLVRERSSCLTVGHDRVFVNKGNVIDAYELNGTLVCSFGDRTLSNVIDIAGGSDGQIFVLEGRLTNNNKIARVFSKDGHQQNEFRVNGKEDDYSRLASHPSGEHIVFSGFERKTGRLKVAMYRKDGVLNRSFTLGERLYRDNYDKIYGIAVTHDGSVAISFNDQENQTKVIVRPMKPC